jgi:hypothetical protein
MQTSCRFGGPLRSAGTVHHLCLVHRAERLASATTHQWLHSEASDARRCTMSAIHIAIASVALRTHRFVQIAQ